MKYGYLKITPENKESKAQVATLKSLGVGNNLYIDEMSPESSYRPNFYDLKKKLISGDELYIIQIDHFAQSVEQVFNLINEFEKNGITFTSIAEPYLSSTHHLYSMAKDMLTTFSSIEKKRRIIKSMTGLNKARKNGKIGGNKKGVSKKYIEIASKVYKMYEDGTPISAIREHFEIGSNTTIYKCIELVKTKQVSYTMETIYNGVRFTQEEVEVYNNMFKVINGYNRELGVNKDAKKPYYSKELLSKYSDYMAHKKTQELKDAGICSSIFINRK
jgi:DNA invertase Pin-like site-specific DNA recombinase